jgi:hypothetical protein
LPAERKRHEMQLFTGVINHPVLALRGHPSFVKEGKVKIINTLTYSFSLRRSTTPVAWGGGGPLLTTFIV